MSQSRPVWFFMTDIEFFFLKLNRLTDKKKDQMTAKRKIKKDRNALARET